MVLRGAPSRPNKTLASLRFPRTHQLLRVVHKTTTLIIANIWCRYKHIFPCSLTTLLGDFGSGLAYSIYIFLNSWFTYIYILFYMSIKFHLILAINESTIKHRLKWDRKMKSIEEYAYARKIIKNGGNQTTETGSNTLVGDLSPSY